MRISRLYGCVFCKQRTLPSRLKTRTRNEFPIVGFLKPDLLFTSSSSSNSSSSSSSSSGGGGGSSSSSSSGCSSSSSINAALTQVRYLYAVIKENPES